MHRDAQRDHGALDVLARLAVLDLAAGELPCALRHVDEILAHDDAGTLAPEAQHRCWQVLLQAGDGRAATLLRNLHGRLAQLLAQLPDAGDRRRLIDTLPHWRDVDHEAARLSDR